VLLDSTGAGTADTNMQPSKPCMMRLMCVDFNGGGHYISGSRGTAERRSLLEVNLNKAITKKLVSAIHYQQVSCPLPLFTKLPV